MTSFFISVAGVEAHVRDPIAWVIFMGGAFLLVSALQIFSFWRHEPLIIVATDDYLGVAYRNGIKKKIPWPSLNCAKHSTGLMGMKWSLGLTPKENIVLRDVGIDAERWGVLRKCIAEKASMQGVKVFVDPLSVLAYGDFGLL